MSNRIRQCLALLLTLALCTTGVPLSAWAEATQPEDPEVTTEVQEDAVEPQVLFRTHAIGAPSWNDDEGWDSYAPSQESEDNVGDPLLESEDAKCELTPLDSLQLQLLGLDAANGISYRIRDANGEWQQEWTSSPNAATCELGITGLQVRLSEELDATYDLWYCAKDNNGAQMDWVLADQALQTEGVEPLCGFEAVLVANSQTPDQTDEGSTPAQDDTQEDGALDQSLATDLDETQADSQPNPDPEPVDDASGEESDPNGGNALVDAPEATEAPTEEEPSVTVQQDNNATEPTNSTKSSTTTSKTSTSSAIEVVKTESTTSKKKSTSKKSTSVVQPEQAAPSLLYRARVQQTGWQGWKKNGKTAGTSGKGLYVDGLRFILKNADGGLSYRVRIQGEGWQPTVTNSKATGKKSQPIEAVKIKLTGGIAKTYDIYYRAHVQNKGWQKWVKNGTVVGTSKKGLQIEAIEVLLVKKGDTIPTNTTSGKKYRASSTVTSKGIRYQSYVEGSGWKKEVASGKSSGSASQSSYIGAYRVTLTGLDGGISYRAYQGSGWKKSKKNGAISGTPGKSQKVEAIRLKLTGNAKKQYDVYYRTYLQNVGWTSWAKNGESSGAVGFGYGIQQIQIRLRKKTVQALTGGGDIPFACLGDTDITYSSRALNGSWQNPRADGATCGTVGKSGRIDLIRANLPASDEYGIAYSVSNNANAWQAWKSDGEIAGQAGQNLTAIRFKLTGILTTYYDIWYRAHIANVGWLGWTRNGAAAGSDSDTTPVEAFQIQLRPKGAAVPGSTQTAYKIARQLNGVDISGWDEGINISKLDADFVIIKATEGVQGTIYNPWYKSWADKALADGKLIGFYHYANGGDPIKEADCFYNAIAEFKGRAVACLDWEGQGNPTFDTGKDVAWCKKFLNRLKSRYGGTPLLYTSKNYTNAYDWSSVAASYPLWGAEYPDFKDVNGYQSDPWQSSRPWGAWGKNPLIFQYTSTGVLLKNGGIEHFDFNLFYGTVGDWKALLK